MKKLVMTLAAAAVFAIGSAFAQDTQAPAASTADGSQKTSGMGCCAAHASAGAKCSAPAHAGMGMWSGMLKQYTSKLELTDAQQDRLKAIFAAAQDWAMQHRPAQADHMQKFVEEFKKDQMDESALTSMVEGRAQERADAIVFWRQTIAQVHDVLTPQQRAKAAEMIGSFVQKMSSDPHAGAMQPMHQDAK